MATVANPTPVTELCPACSSKGRKVAPLTVRALVKPELTGRVRDETYRFCESPACDVVYFSEQHPEQRFYRADLRVRVGQKETTPPIQVCYCFDWTTDDIERELRLTGDTTIPERIKRMVQQGYCHCETMNPQGSCCLGNVNKAVKEVRAKLAALPAPTLPSPNLGEGRVGAAPATRKPMKEKGALLATLGAVFTALLGTACCWLPLLLITFGFSAVGIGSFFEQYRPYFLTATFTLLAVAWYFTYRSAIWRVWARLQGKPAPASAVEACCATEATSAPAHSCCATEPEPKPAAVHCCCGIEAEPEAEDCCAPPAKTVAGQPARRRFTMRQFNQVMLWMATVMIVLFALFPQCIGLLLGGGGNSTAAVNPNAQQVVLELQGMTCEGCAATVQQALRQVPGVSQVQVNYDRAEAVLYFDPCCAVQPEALIDAVGKAGYTAQLKK
jgi:copper chaperone CopZ